MSLAETALSADSDIIRMPSSSGNFLFVTLAMNQTLFFEALARAVREAGREVNFLCFHERSHDYLGRGGWRSFNAFRAGGMGVAVPLTRYSWPSLNLILSHEKAAFEIRDTGALLRKLGRYLSATESTLDALSALPGKITVVQELGGFLSNMATFYAARRRGLDNIFIEPAFFRGRVAFLRNTFAAPRVVGPRSPHANEEVRAYLDEAVAKQQVVIPVKDTRHYRAPSSKLTDLYNLRRLAEKSVDRYLLGKREEFGHIGGHVSRHLRMYLSARALSTRYRALPKDPFIYYPLHVPADVALTIRSPQYVDQLALIDYLARIVPDTHQVLIKEHPALIGAVDRRRVLGLLKVRDNVRLVHPSIPNYEVLRHADAVVTVNSKSGAEALLLRKPVIVLGDAFYAACNLVHRVDALGDLPVVLQGILHGRNAIDAAAVTRYFQDVWDKTWPGELHVADEDNARKFAESLLNYIARGAEAEAEDR